MTYGDDKMFEVNKELHELVHSQFEKTYTIDNPNKAVLAFAAGKAYKSHQAVIALCERGFGEDAFALTRVLLEIAISTEYIFKDETFERAKRFMSYDWITRRKLHKNFFARRGLNIKKRTNADLDIRTIMKEAKEAQKKYGYSASRGWADVGFREMAKELGINEPYATSYSLQSDLLHFSANTVNNYVKIEGDNFTVNVTKSENWVDQALAVAFTAFLRITSLWDEQFHFGIEKELEKIADKYTEVSK